MEDLNAFSHFLRHGLSYTTFEYSDLVLTTSRPSSNAEDFSVTVSLNVTNTGKLAGSEIVQVYVSLPPTQWSHVHPLSQLKGFTKAKDIKPGEKRAIKIVLDKYAVSYWEESIERWRAEVGEYHIQVGKSSDNIALSDKFALEKVLEWNGL
jgi:beta-glucosidase